MGSKNAWIQPIALGLSDGILNALILATPAILKNGSKISINLGLRVAAVAALTAIFTVFVSDYAHLRADLSRAEHELNISTSGRLAAGNLGKLVTRQAGSAAIRASLASFAGSLLPLMVAAAAPQEPWIAILVALISLGILGAILARIVASKPLVWFIVSVGGGAVVALIGSQLNIV